MGARLGQGRPLWRDWFLIAVVARAYEEAEPLVKRRATDTVVLLALDINGDLSTVRVGVIVDNEHEVVDIVIIDDERDGEPGRSRSRRTTTAVTGSPRHPIPGGKPIPAGSDPRGGLARLPALLGHRTLSRHRRCRSLAFR